MNTIFDDTLFLDRDGVINVQIHHSYVNSVADFKFTLDARHALCLLAKAFRRVIVVTNQAGVGKGYMSMAALDVIHQQMVEAIEADGGRIDRIYVCTSADNNHPDRKPNPGMALAARRDFPDIDFARSIMVGDMLSDMQFAQAAGLQAVLINPELASEEPPVTEISSIPLLAVYPNLITFAKIWTNNIVE